MRRSKRRRLARLKRAARRVNDAREDVVLALSDITPYRLPRYDHRQWRRHLRAINRGFA